MEVKKIAKECKIWNEKEEATESEEKAKKFASLISRFISLKISLI